MVKQLRTPFVLLAIAGLLGAGVYWFESRKSLPRPEAQGDMSQPIVTAPERDIEALTIKTVAQTFVLEKISSTGWMLRSPKPEGKASETSVAFLTNLLVGKGDRLPAVAADRKAEFGLNLPLATIEIQLPNQQRQTLVLGNLNFNRTGRYAAVNPSVDPNASVSMLLVSPNFESAVTRAVSEWRSAILKKPVN